MKSVCGHFLCVGLIASASLFPFFRHGHRERRSREPAATRESVAVPEATAADVSYSSVKGDALRTLDVYTRDKTGVLPVAVWVHGGGWDSGDKSHVLYKPGAFMDHGCVFVSINYRLAPKASYKDQGDDVAAALAWVHGNIKQYGGDPEQIFLLGHSAGAHLAALTATDETYLKSKGLPLTTIKGVVLLDGAGYNIPLQVENAGPRNVSRYETVFGTDPAVQIQASPVSHAARGKGIPPFQLHYCAQRETSEAQAEGFAKALTAAGVSAAVIPEPGKSHEELNKDLGKPGDPTTEKVFEFLDGLSRSGERAAPDAPRGRRHRQP